MSPSRWLGVMLTFAGAFAGFTYLRPFLESYTQVSLPQLSLLLLGLGLSGFAGTYGASALVGRHLFSLLCGLPMALAAVTIGPASSRPLALGRSCHDGCVGYAELCDPGSLVYLVVQRHQRRARKRRGPHGGGDSTRHHAGARVSGDCCSTIFRLRQRSLEALILLAIASVAVGNGESISPAGAYPEKECRHGMRRRRSPGIPSLSRSL